MNGKKTKDQHPFDGVLVYPLTYQSVDWSQYISRRIDVTGVSPTRMLDRENRDMREASYLASLTPEISPIQAIMNKEHYNHIFMSYLTDIDLEHINNISRRTDIATYVDGDFKILSATLDRWMFAFDLYCRQDSVDILRYLFNAIIIFMERAGFNIFKKKKSIKDGTFIWS